METFQDKKHIANADLLKALGHPIRLAMAQLLLQRGTVNVTTIYTSLNLPQSTASLHLAKLKNSGVVKAQRQGLEVFYELGTDQVRSVLQSIVE